MDSLVGRQTPGAFASEAVTGFVDFCPKTGRYGLEPGCDCDVEVEVLDGDAVVLGPVELPNTRRYGFAVDCAAPAAVPIGAVPTMLVGVPMGVAVPIDVGTPMEVVVPIEAACPTFVGVPMVAGATVDAGPYVRCVSDRCGMTDRGRHADLGWHPYLIW
jgi:hypothetical protein